jgi:transposase
MIGPNMTRDRKQRKRTAPPVRRGASGGKRARRFREYRPRELMGARKGTGQYARNRRLLIRLYKKGMSGSQIASEYDVGRDKVFKIIQAAGGQKVLGQAPRFVFSRRNILEAKWGTPAYRAKERRIAELYTRGASPLELIRLFRIGRDRLTGILHRKGVPIRKRGSFKKTIGGVPQWTAKYRAIVRRIVRLYSQGASSRQLAKIFPVSHARICRIVRQAGGTVRESH